MADQVHDALEENIGQWAEMTRNIVGGLNAPDYGGDSEVVAAASALQLAGKATSILIPKTAPALAMPILILEEATRKFEEKHQKALEAANKSKAELETSIKDRLQTAIYEAEQDFYGSPTYGKILKELHRHLKDKGIDGTSTEAFRQIDHAIDNATVNGKKIVPSKKSNIRGNVQSRYNEIFETLRTLHRAVSANVGSSGIFGLQPYIRKDSDLSAVARQHLGNPKELCRNPGANLQKKPPDIRKGVCGDKASDAVFEAYYISGTEELQALVSNAWPMALKLKTGAAKNGATVVPNERRISRWHVELVATERDNFQRNAGDAVIQRAKHNTGKVIRSLKEELDKQIG